jgi:hypothetical protein
LLLRQQQNDNPTWQNGQMNTTNRNPLPLVTMFCRFLSLEKLTMENSNGNGLGYTESNIVSPTTSFCWSR